MTYEEKKEIEKAVTTLKEHCIENFDVKTGCKTECIFLDSNRNSCKLEYFPCSWDIPIVRRWTPEDVALAKALKSVGATHIYGSTSHLRMWKNENMSGYLPVLSFRNIEDREAVRIDDIIKEAEG